VNSWIDFFDTATAQQDYAWFVVALAWVALSAMAWRVRRVGSSTDSFIWAHVCAVAGLAHACVEIAVHVLPTAPSIRARVGVDYGLSATLALQIGAIGWFAVAGWSRRSRTALRLSGVGLLTLVVAVRPWSYPICSAALALLGALVAWAWLRRLAGEESRVAWVAASGVALLPLLATVGPVAEATTHMRRFAEVSRLGLPAALAALLAAGGIIFSLRPSQRKTSAPSASFPAGELRRFGFALTVWLSAGFGLTVMMGRIARQNFEENFLAGAALAARLIDTKAVADCVGPAFQVSVPRVFLQSSGREHLTMNSPHLTVERLAPLRRMLTQVRLANTRAIWTHLMAVRSGYLVSYAFDERVPQMPGEVPVVGPVRDTELLAWAERRPRFEGVIIGGWGALVRASAPIIAADGRMLGWLAIDLPAIQWVASQAQARLQAFAVVGLGVVLAGGSMLLRQRAADRERAAAAAVVALAADRAKTEFLAKVSHELRTPIQNILGYGELLAAMPLSDVARDWLRAQRAQGELMVRLVNDLIDLGALETGAFRLVPQPVRLDVLMGEIVDSLRPRAARKNLTLVCEIDPRLSGWVAADATRVRQIALNLVGNAVKFTGEGGVRIALRLAAEPGPEMMQCELAVRDTGPGIPLEERSRLFQPFARLRPDSGVEGAGLGLALTRALCHGMGGDLNLVDDGEPGAQFVARLHFPRATAPLAAASVTGGSSLTGLRVLVVDDNTLVRTLFVAALESNGAICRAAADGETALHLCAAEFCDTLVTDLSMPGLDGFELARRVRAKAQTAGRAVRIVGVSAHAGATEKAQALAAGMDAFLVKPVDLSALVRAAVPAAEVSFGGNAATALPPALQAGLRAAFVRETPPLIAALGRTVAACEWTEVRACAHYLKNSTDVLGLARTSQELERLHTAAASADPAAAAGALAAIHALLATEAADLLPAIPWVDSAT
jgi:signal transduction histidine kinase/DNA-binding NarL/FixJ family response regulator